jgi:DNA polymerase-1
MSANGCSTNGTFSAHVRAAALAAGGRGFRVVLNHAPTPDGGCTCPDPACGSQGKHPRGGTGWQDRATSDRDELGRQLDDRPDSNIGYELTNGLTDADFDAAESARAAAILMPPTGLVGGRPSAPSSHWFYLALGTESAEYADPVLIRGGQAKRANMAELRVNGQTVVAPSRHRSGETYLWESDGEPVEVEPAALSLAVAETAAAGLFGRYWRESIRHKASLPLAGWLRRNGWEPARIEKFVRAVAAAGRDDGVENRVAAALDTVARYDAGKETTGLPTLVDLLAPVGEDVCNAVAKWLRLRTTGTGPRINFGGGDSVNSANSVEEWPAPVPLSAAPDTPEYPVDVLPPWLREWAEATSVELQVPVDLPAGLGVGLVGGGVARKVVVRPRPGFTEPVNTFVMASMPPGERKTQTFKKATGPVLELERELIEAAWPVIQEAESEQRIAEKRVKHLEDKLAKADDPAVVDQLREELKTAREKFLAAEVPSTPLLYTEDDTPESLKHDLICQDGRLMVATTEARCLENITLFSDRPNFDVYLKGHAGDEMRTGRISRGRESITDPALTCLLAPQPAVMQGLAENTILRGRGFLARWFYLLPRSRVGFRVVACPAVPAAVQARYHHLIRSAWQIGYAKDEFGNPVPTVLVFDDEAEAAFADFERWVEPQLAPGRPLAALAGWGNKLNGHRAWIAAALHIADALGVGEDWSGAIGVGAVGRAVRLCKDYYIPHAIAAFDLMGANATLTGARRVWKWVADNRLTAFSKRDGFVGNRAGFETVDELQPCLDLLERHYLIRPRQAQQRTGPGRKPSPVYEVNPHNPEGPGEQPPPAEPGPRPPAHNSQNTQNSPPGPASGDSVNCAHSVRGVPTAGNVAAGGGGPVAGAGDTGYAEPVGDAGYTLITDPAGVGAVVAAVEDSGGPVGLDCETTGLVPFSDQVRLLQVATERGVFVIDVLALPDHDTPVLADLFDVLARVEVVAHNAQFDLRFLARHGFTPSKVFDTMLASRVLHAGDRGENGARLKHGLEDVAARELGKALDKSEQESDWSRPTLAPTQYAYAAADAEVLLPLAEALKSKLAAADLTATAELEMRALPGVAWAAPVTVDAAAWSAIADAAAAEVTRLADEMTALAPNRGDLFESRNWSSVEQVKAAFDSLGITLGSTDDDALAALDHPLAEKLRDYRAATKRTGTYGKGWLRKHAGDGRVLPSWNQLGAESGRMSCSHPNLQNIPRGSEYRRCFVARPGHVLVKADYSQIELRVAAKVADEKVMIAAYRDGRDLHTLTAARITGKAEGDVTKADRQMAKAVNFGLLYGMGWKSLRGYALANYGVVLTDDQARDYRAAFFGAYPGLAAWHRRTRDRITRLGRAFKTVHEVRTLGGRRRTLPLFKKNAEGTLYPNVTDALNTPVQGTAADGLKIAVALLWERRMEALGAVPMIFCHDEIVVEVPEGDAANAREWVRCCMTEALTPVIEPVPIEVEVTVGRTWGG